MARPFRTLVEMLENSLTDFGPNEVFGEKMGDETWRYIHYREFGEQVASVRAGLSALGVEKGDRIGIISDNCISWAVSAFATYTLGACVVPMYEAQHPDEWEFILNDSGAKVAIGADERVYRAVSERMDKMPALGHVIGMKLPAEHEHSLQKLAQRGKASPVPNVFVEPSDLAAFLYTSGTTGSPKGVELSHGNISSNVCASSARTCRSGRTCRAASTRR